MSLATTSFRTLVRDINDVEQMILGVCPLDIGEQYASAVRVLSGSNSGVRVSLLKSLRSGKRFHSSAG